MLFALFYIFLASTGDVPLRKASVVKSGQMFQIEDHVSNPNAVATATFEDGLEITGWGVLNVNTNSNYEDFDQAYAAGIVEGYLTAKRILDHAAIVQDALFAKYGGKMPEQVENFFMEQNQWVNQQIENNRESPSDVWHQMTAIQNQYDGLILGYNLAAESAGLSMLGNLTFAMLNGVGDLFQIIPSVMPSERINWLNLTEPEQQMLFHKRTHCSAIVKVTGDLSDLMYGHSSWFEFAHTNRIFKTYNFNYQHTSTKSKRISFSSYPGFLESLDDFYMMSSGLGMTQTSNEVFDSSLLDLITPQSLLAWQRVRLASVMATTGSEWQQYFSTNPSGTYVNQYMIVNMNLFKPGNNLANGTLYVVEEMPGLILGGDVTQQLERGHWPSYNIPYFQEIYDKSGYGTMNEQSANEYWSYQLCPRAKIFRRDAGNVHDMDGMKRILRYNDFKNDPYSFDGKSQNPFYAICSRGDLDPQRPQNFGCYDTKVTSFKHGFFNQQADILNGPTRGDDEYSPFTWIGKTDLHQGLPQTYNFSFLTVNSPGSGAQ